jgi:DnaJ-class molecular chaperone
MRDPYDVLGVQKNASAADVKKAYRRLAKKLHPDANKKDPKAAAKFAELNSAYEIVGDDDKRRAYDRGEIDGEGKPRFHGFERAGAGRGSRDFGDGAFESFSFGPDGFRRTTSRGSGGAGGFEDILGDIFGGMGGSGRRPRAGFERHAEGDDVASSGRGQDVSAAVTISLAEAAAGTSQRIRLPTGKDVEVKVPPGLADGQQIRLKGQGLAGPSGTGDALITVNVAPHPYFKVDGANLRLDLPVSLYEAVLGAKVRVPTLDGAVELALPAGASSGRTFRLKGKGLPGKSGPGDLFVTARIVLPDGSDADLEELMRAWRDGKPYDPRRDMG